MITSKMFGDRGRRRAETLGIDPARLPPGQSPTEKWPVLTVGPTPEVDVETWSLAIYGEVDAPFALRWDELLALPQVMLTRDIHCVTRWSKFDVDFEGVRVIDLLDRAQVRDTATHALVHAYGGYTTNLALDDLAREDNLIAIRAEGRPLEPDHGGPARLLVPHLYLWKSAKWVQSIELLAGDEAGFWERNGYHHRGDPFAEERFGPGADPASVRAVRRAHRAT